MTSSSCSNQSNTTFTLSDLSSWITSHGGFIHPSLSLRDDELPTKKSATTALPSSSTLTTTTPSIRSRGIITTDDIPNGTLLIRLPSTLALSGRNLPPPPPSSKKKSTSSPSHDDRHSPLTQPSPWLRSLTNLLLAKKTPQRRQRHSSLSIDYSPYLSSLPSQISTLSTWTSDDRLRHLIGTSLHLAQKNDDDGRATRDAYERRVRPFLDDYFSEDDDDVSSYDDFVWAAGVLSTRGFHRDDDDDDDERNEGPYLLPFVDLLNHSSSTSSSRCTTLRREDDDFVARAERDVVGGEEILHSYGDLTAGQFLRTFGFVPREVTVEMVRRARGGGGGDDDDVAATTSRGRGLTPSVLTRDDLVAACRFVAFSKDVGDLKELMLGGGEDDDDDDDAWWDASDSWQSKVDYLTGETRTSSSSGGDGENNNSSSSSIMIDLPNDYLIPFPIDDSNSDDIRRIVTCTVILLLPDVSSITELFHDGFSLLDETVIFQDYYLGHLIVRSLLRAIATKQSSYGDGVTMMDDVTAMEDCLRRYEELDRGEIRKMEGLTVRLEERWCLERLKGRVLGWLEKLERDDASDADGSCGEAADCKRVKR